MMRLPWSSISALALVSLFARTAAPYHFVTVESPDGELVTLSWDSTSMPLPWSFHAMPAATLPLQQAIDAVDASFDTWEAIATASLSVVFEGTTNAEPFIFFDFINTLGFTDDPDLAAPGVLGVSSWLIDIFSGEIVESDIAFSNKIDWFTGAGGSPDRFDFQSVATHEIGHFLGLDHSGLGIVETSAARGSRRRLLEGSAVMFPFAFPSGSTTGRTLTPDDLVGISLLYPASGFSSERGSLSGSVTLDDRPLLGAHVLTFNPFTGESISVFTNEEGEFEVEGLKPGPHVVRVNPIADPTSPEDYGFSESGVDLDFRDALFEGSAGVEAGGSTGGIDVEVTR